MLPVHRHGDINGLALVYISERQILQQALGIFISTSSCKSSLVSLHKSPFFLCFCIHFVLGLTFDITISFTLNLTLPSLIMSSFWIL